MGIQMSLSKEKIVRNILKIFLLSIILIGSGCASIPSKEEALNIATMKFFHQWVEDNWSKNGELVYHISFVDKIGHTYFMSREEIVSSSGALNNLFNRKDLNSTEKQMIEEWVQFLNLIVDVNPVPVMSGEWNELYEKNIHECNIALAKKTDDCLEEKVLNKNSSALIPLVINDSQNEKVTTVLYYLGVIRFKENNRTELILSNFFFKEVIRRFPKSELSRNAYEHLVENIQFGYSKFPESQSLETDIIMLNYYKEMMESDL